MTAIPAPQAATTFEAFAAARTPALLRTAVLLTAGDRAAAEDLVQVALTKAYLAWPRLRGPVDGGSPEAWVRRALTTSFLDTRRLRSAGERPTAEPVPRPGRDPWDQVDERDRLRRALAALPARQRAVVVLRFYDDRSVGEVADLLAIAPGTVKSQASKGLEKLRAALIEETP